MILSHKHKFIFIKGEKVAGTSVEIALSQICGPDDIVTPISRGDERARSGTAGEPRNYARHLYPARLRHALERRYAKSIGQDASRIHAPRARFFNHMDLRAVLRLLPEARDYEILCVERSPYAKVMSFANWVEHFRSYDKTGELPKQVDGLAPTVDRLIADKSISRVRNVDRYRNSDGTVTVKPWTTGTLSDDMAKFFESRGVESVPLANAKRGARSDSIDPRQILRPDQIAAINEIFAEEFALFGWPMIR